MKFATMLAFILVLIGAFVWLTIGLFNFNVVAWIFGSGMTAIVSRIIYSLVGLSAIWLIISFCIYRPFKVID